MYGSGEAESAAIIVPQSLAGTDVVNPSTSFGPLKMIKTALSTGRVFLVASLRRQFLPGLGGDVFYSGGSLARWASRRTPNQWWLYTPRRHSLRQ